ncbi:Death-associated protein kinase related [Eumeta japonica]|uniref:Death-associated protein kinase related n=1 Tax=Eumeta variegata TaxID=151549 RepID=A0A4C1X1N3_EUMVA|nr:Death-associated protein kinase related [Eumeta japonica]
MRVLRGRGFRLTPRRKGKFASVRKIRHLKSGVEYAAKFIRKRRRAADATREIQHEVAVLALCAQCDRVVKLHEQIYVQGWTWAYSFRFPDVRLRATFTVIYDLHQDVSPPSGKPLHAVTSSSSWSPELFFYYRLLVLRGIWHAHCHLKCLIL